MPRGALVQVDGGTPLCTHVIMCQVEFQVKFLLFISCKGVKHSHFFHVRFAASGLINTTISIYVSDYNSIQIYSIYIIQML